MCRTCCPAPISMHEAVVWVCFSNHLDEETLCLLHAKEHLSSRMFKHCYLIEAKRVTDGNLSRKQSCKHGRIFIFQSTGSSALWFKCDANTCKASASCPLISLCMAIPTSTTRHWQIAKSCSSMPTFTPPHTWQVLHIREENDVFNSAITQRWFKILITWRSLPQSYFLMFATVFLQVQRSRTSWWRCCGSAWMRRR